LDKLIKKYYLPMMRLLFQCKENSCTCALVVK